MKPIKSHNKQQGVAIIMVLLVFFMATVIISGILLQQRYAIKQSAYLFSTLQSEQYAFGAESLARQILYRDATDANNKKEVDYLGEAWAVPKNIFPIDQGELFYRIEDLQGRFNLNNLVEGPEWVERFQLLLASLQINTAYAQRLADWMDEGSETSGASGAEDNEYLLLTPPYRTANQTIKDVSELRLLLGMKEKEYQTLLPYVTALPTSTSINVNTVSTNLLRALAPELSGATLEAIVAQQRKGFTSVDDFLGLDGMPASLKDDGALSVATQYFAVYAEVHFDDRHTQLKSMLYREASGNIRLVSRDFSISATMNNEEESADKPNDPTNQPSN